MIRITKATPKSVIEEIGKECDRCNNCCKYDAGIVLEEDIPRIAKHLNMNNQDFKEKHLIPHERFNKACYKPRQEKEKGKPYGRCTFLDEQKGCMIHDVKPLHCKVCSAKSKNGEAITQWFALNYLVDKDDAESVRQWSIFLQYNTPIPGGKLEELVPDKARLKSMLNYGMLK